VQKQWLAHVPWDSVVTLHAALCRDRQLDTGQNAKAYETARQLWERTLPRTLPLPEVLDVCRQCHDLLPFAFNNANTFSAIAKTLIEECAKRLPPVEAQILRVTVAHYVVGLIGRRELTQVLRHFETKCAPQAATGLVAPPLEAPRPQPGAS
jgi:hypothetical protein